MNANKYTSFIEVLFPFAVYKVTVFKLFTEAECDLFEMFCYS